MMKQSYIVKKYHTTNRQYIQGRAFDLFKGS